MIKQKPLLPPFRAAIPNLLSPKSVPANQVNTTNVVLPDSNQAKNPQSRTATNSDSANPKSDPNDPKSSTSLYEDSFRDPRLTAFNRNVEAMRNTQGGNAAEKQTMAQTTKPKSIFLKPLDEKRLRDSLILADGGEEGAASGDVKYNPKTGNIESPTDKPTVNSIVPAEYSSLADIMSNKLGWFDFTGWDDLPPSQQRSRLLRAGVDGESMMQLLNAGTSLETIALIQDIERNRITYGLSRVEVQDISDQLLEIANARIDAKNHSLPFSTSPVVTKIFLKTLDEKEHELIGPYMNRKGTTDVPFTAKNAKEDNRIPLKKGEYIDYNVVDLTDDLYKFMRYGAQLVKYLKDTAGIRKANFLNEFQQLVKSYGALDIKHQEPWKFRDGLTYLFNGEVMRNDDVGNIAFGYYGAAVYGKDFLHTGAGLYQLWSDIKGENPIQWNGKFFDDPQDYDMIEYGYRLYLEEHPN